MDVGDGGDMGVVVLGVVDGGWKKERSLPSSTNSCGFQAESRNSAEFHGISMESNWLEPQPFWFAIPWKFPLFSEEFRQNSAEIPPESHGKYHNMYCQK